MDQGIRLFVGHDQRESVAYHVFCQSVIEHTTVPLAIYPLARGFFKEFNGQRDGTNAFTFLRYLVPLMCDYKGWAIFADGDMVVSHDLADLWAYKDVYIDKACAVVKHDYKTRHPRKYVGSDMESANVDYPRKNWSSVILWNCGHYANRMLTEEYVALADPAVIHRFGWLQDDWIGELPADWNYLVGEYPPGPAHLFHHTLGIPGINYYSDVTTSWKWHGALLSALQCAGENPVEMVKRAEDRVGEL